MGKIKTVIVALCIVVMSFGVVYAGEKGQNVSKISPEEKECIMVFIDFGVSSKISWKERIYQAYRALIASGRYSACEARELIKEYFKNPTGWEL